MSVFSLSPLTRALKFLETKEASSQGKDWKSSLQLLQSLCALVRNPWLLSPMFAGLYYLLVNLTLYFD